MKIPRPKLPRFSSTAIAPRLDALAMVAGAVLLVVAAFAVHDAVGFAATGVSLILLGGGARRGI